MEHSKWLTLNVAQEMSGGYYIHIDIDENELLGQLKDTLHFTDIFDMDEIQNDVLDNMKDEEFIEYCKNNINEFYDQLSKSIEPKKILSKIPTEDILEYVEENELVSKKNDNMFNIEDSKKYLTPEEQQVLSILITKILHSKTMEKLKEGN